MSRRKRKNIFIRFYDWFKGTLVGEVLIAILILPVELFRSKTRKTRKEQKESEGFWKSLLVALVLAIFFRTFMYEPFNIPSGSMIPTLEVGDHIFVGKLSYGYSKYSLPYSLPLFSGRIFYSEPERGDVVVFRNPIDKNDDFIKRLIGLPGDKIQMVNGVLHINDESVEKEYIGKYLYLTLPDTVKTIKDIPVFSENGTEYVTIKDGKVYINGTYSDIDYTVFYQNGSKLDCSICNALVSLYKETLPNGVSYNVIELSDDADMDDTPAYIVPKDHFFCMGDNRDNSTDSRRLSKVGYIPKQFLVGEAKVIFHSHNGAARFWEFWRWPKAIHWGRYLDSIE